MLTFFTPLLYAWFISNFTPGQTLIDKVYKLLPNNIQFTRKYLECFKCLSFWITLLITFNLSIAILFSLIAYLYNLFINSKLYI